MRRHHGFTLIELMIVIAILGILIAIALPAYQDYTIRARLSEGINLAGPAKMAVSETRLSENVWPSTNAEAGAYRTVDSTYVTSVGISSGGVITISYTNTESLGAAAGTTLVLTPSFIGGSVVWDCNGHEGYGNAGTVQPRFVPANCR